MKTNDPLLTSKELAAVLRKSTSYVYAMRRLGFKMPGRTATVSDALSFLRRVKSPRSACH